MSNAEVLYQLKPGRRVERNIDDRKVRFRRGHTAQGLCGIVSFTADFQIWLLVKEIGQPFADQWMIVHEKNPAFALVTPRC
jgi:hypothetical protein